MANCANCGAAMRLAEGRLVCDHCGSQQELPAALEYLELLGPSSWLCPLCSRPLSESRLDELPLLCCPGCFGMLIQMHWFAAVIDAARLHETRPVHTLPPRRQSPGDRSLQCPTCGETMIDQLYGGPGNVVIDTCERCGVNWLDPGELRRIATAPDSARPR
jgi:Zn-finger nucleic acid-binding protein